MVEAIPDTISPGLIERFRERDDQTPLHILKEQWRSIACMTCGACCFSSVVPITDRDFDAFHRRFGGAMSRDDFAAMFLQDPDTAAPTYTIETKRYGGRCMFLGRRGCFECIAWDARPEVCREFFCWEMANFGAWLDGDEQDTFAPGGEWMDNFNLLMTRLRTEAPLSFFPDDMKGYQTLLAQENAPSYFETHPERFGASNDG